MPQQGDERLKQTERILLPKEKYFDTDINEIETIILEEANDKELQGETAREEENQKIRKAFEEVSKEMKGIAVGLCKWEDGYLVHQGTIWVPNDEGIRIDLIRRHHDIPQAWHGGTAKITELLQCTY